MTNRRTKLELTWIGKEHRPRLEPRILVEDPGLSYHAPHRVGSADVFDNRLIFGDNLLALKALEAEFAGQVKCVYIDPPYNTGSAFTHYDDGIEHSLWLSLIRDRLELMRQLLREDGSIWISIDDHEAHYLKVLCDEVFGRENFVSTVVWQKLFTVKNSARYLSDMHDFVLVYARNKANWERNLLPRSQRLDDTYTNPDGDPRGPWTTNAIQARNYYSLGSYEITSPTGEVFSPPPGTYWRVSSATFEELIADGRIWWGREGSAIPRIKKFLSEAKAGVVPSTLWLHTEAGSNAEAKIESRRLFGEGEDPSVFITPKPERLIALVLELATNPGDLVLDSFAGSGTTGAVAHKMGRRWIMVELGEHCHTHVIPRLRKVVDGSDPGGVTEATGWKGGGGFRYFRLAPSLLEKDRFGNWVISKQFNPAMLAEALCKLHGFRYQPSEDVYWIHGRSTERDFLYVTTQTLTAEQLQNLSEEVGPERSLLVCCGAFRGDRSRWGNLTIEKIPQSVLDRCEWGHDDYSLAVANLPTAPPAEAAPDIRAPRRTAVRVAGQASLFDDDGGER